MDELVAEVADALADVRDRDPEIRPIEAPLRRDVAERARGARVCIGIAEQAQRQRIRRPRAEPAVNIGDDAVDERERGLQLRGAIAAPRTTT